MAAMGEKISARNCATKAGVPIVPGIGEPEMTNEELLDACRELQFPLLVKPAAGGGGKGLHVAHDINDLREVLPTARREAKTAFGDETLLVEKYLLHARHIRVSSCGRQSWKLHAFKRARMFTSTAPSKSCGRSAGTTVIGN